MEHQKTLNLLNEATESKFVNKKIKHCQGSIKCELWWGRWNYP